MIELFAYLGYFAIAFLVTRPIYGYLRKRSIEYNIREYPPLYQHSRFKGYNLEYYGFKQDYWNKSSRPFVVYTTACLSLFWPVMLAIPVGLGAYKYMTGSKIRSTAELEAEKAELSDRINKLEKELGIRDK